MIDGESDNAGGRARGATLTLSGVDMRSRQSRIFLAAELDTPLARLADADAARTVTCLREGVACNSKPAPSEGQTTQQTSVQCYHCSGTRSVGRCCAAEHGFARVKRRVQL